MKSSTKADTKLIQKCSEKGYFNTTILEDVKENLKMNENSCSASLFQAILNRMTNISTHEEYYHLLLTILYIYWNDYNGSIMQSFSMYSAPFVTHLPVEKSLAKSAGSGKEDCPVYEVLNTKLSKHMEWLIELQNYHFRINNMEKIQWWSDGTFIYDTMNTHQMLRILGLLLFLVPVWNDVYINQSRYPL